MGSWQHRAHDAHFITDYRSANILPNSCNPTCQFPPLPEYQISYEFHGFLFRFSALFLAPAMSRCIVRVLEVQTKFFDVMFCRKQPFFCCVLNKFNILLSDKFFMLIKSHTMSSYDSMAIVKLQGYNSTVNAKRHN